MIDELLGGLADELTPGGPGGTPGQLRLRQGTIVSVQANGTVTITIGGDSTELSGIKVASHVCPIPGTTCWLAVDGRDLFVIATLTPAGPAFGRMRQSVAQAVASATTWTGLSFTNRTSVATEGLTDGATGFTVLVPGWYQVNATVTFGSNATGYRGLRLIVGSTVALLGTLIGAPSAVGPRLAVSGMVEAAVGDIIGAEITQNSGGSLSTAVDPGQSLLSAFWVRPSIV